MFLFEYDVQGDVWPWLTGLFMLYEVNGGALLTPPMLEVTLFVVVEFEIGAVVLLSADCIPGNVPVEEAVPY